jgi:hypothetical protein
VERDDNVYAEKKKSKSFGENIEDALIQMSRRTKSCQRYWSRELNSR